MDIWDLIKWILEFIVAVGNLGLVLYIFVNDKLRYKKEYKAQAYSYWLHSLILKDSLEVINAFFSEYCSVIASQEDLRLKSERITDININFRKQIVDVAEIIDKELADFLSRKTDDLRDYICGRLDNIEAQPSCKESIIEQSIQKIGDVKNEVLKKLYLVDLGSSPYTT